MSLPLRITYEGEDYTFIILSKIINKETTEIKILFNEEVLTLARNDKGEWDARERTVGEEPGIIKSIARNVALRYRL